jgi:leucyl-tRNA synthetase
LYSRFWVKFLKDRGFVGVEEPFKKLINQGMILGTSAFVYGFSVGIKNINLKFGIPLNKIQRYAIPKESYVKAIEGNFDELILRLVEKHLNYYREAGNINVEWDLELSPFVPIHVDVAMVNSSNELNINKFKNWQENLKTLEFILNEDGKYIVGREVEKMSKSKYNVVNPDQIVKDFGADSLRLYEMFLGPLEQAKPWNTAGMSGVNGFLKKFWKLYVGENGLNVKDDKPTAENLKTLHKTIKKVEEDIENFSFNTTVSTFMIACNELTAQKCNSKEILERLLILLSPYAPHIAEQLYASIQFNKIIEVENLPKEYRGISTVPFPKFDASHLVERSKNYPISFNGKMKFTLELPMDMSKEDIEKTVMAHEKTQEQLQGRIPKKVIIVPGKIVNIVG